jgi:hypothetical protein
MFGRMCALGSRCSISDSFEGVILEIGLYRKGLGSRSSRRARVCMFLRVLTVNSLRQSSRMSNRLRPGSHILFSICAYQVYGFVVRLDLEAEWLLRKHAHSYLLDCFQLYCTKWNRILGNDTVSRNVQLRFWRNVPVEILDRRAGLPSRQTTAASSS